MDQPRIHSRAFFWPVLRYRLAGWLYWHIHLWRFNREVERQWPRIWETWNCTWGGGDSGMGALFYPGPDGEIYPSARAETMRDGVEDCAWFRLADRLLERRPDPKAAQMIEGFRRELSPGFSGFLQSPERLRAIRHQLGYTVSSTA